MSKKEDHKIINDTTNSSKIEAIKNLIFGENIAEYNDEFETIKKDIAEKKAVLEDLINSTSQELNKAIDNLSTDINIRITELEDNLDQKVTNLDEQKVGKTQLGDLLIKLGTKISES